MRTRREADSLLTWSPEQRPFPLPPPFADERRDEPLGVLNSGSRIDRDPRRIADADLAGARVPPSPNYLRFSKPWSQ